MQERAREECRLANASVLSKIQELESARALAKSQQELLNVSATTKRHAPHLES